MPKISKNLFNVSKFTKDNNVVAELYLDYCLIKDRNMKKVILWGRLKAGLYQLDLDTSSRNFDYVSTTAQSSVAFATNIADSSSFSTGQ